MKQEIASERPLVVGLIPAAGSSQRMGQDKRLLPFRNSTVLETTVQSLQRGGIWPVVVVLEPGSPCHNLEGLRETIIATNPLPQRGMLSSIRQGLLQIPELAQAAALLPGDHPFVPEHVVAHLLQTFYQQRPLLLAPRYGARRGHPLFIHRVLFEEAARCDDRIGLRQLVSQRLADLLELSFDEPHAEDDLDRPEDLVRLTNNE